MQAIELQTVEKRKTSRIAGNLTRLLRGLTLLIMEAIYLQSVKRMSSWIVSTAIGVRGQQAFWVLF
jgi:hypothetical protein